jgi:nitroreductase
MAETPVDTIMNMGTAQAFTDEPVTIDDLNTIMQAGLAAASAINQQPWFFVAITNQELMDEIAGSGMGFAPPPGAVRKPVDGPSEGEQAVPPPVITSGAKAGLGDSPVAIIIYRNDGSKSPNANFDCGLAVQNMVIAAASLGYGVKIVSSPTMALNGENHDTFCEKMGVDPTMQAVAVLLIGRVDNTVDAATGASTRETLETKTNIIK